MTRSGSRALVWFLPTLVLWAAIVLPSASGAAWSSLDDGVSLTVAREGPGRAFDFLAGRIIPVYWLHNWAVFRLAGPEPGAWYLIQSLEILLALALVHSAVVRLTHRGWAGALASGSVVTASSIGTSSWFNLTENRVLLCYAALAWLLARSMDRPSGEPPGRLGGPLVWGGLALVAALAVFSKESAVTLLALGAGGYALAWRGPGLRASATVRRLFGGLLLVVAAVDLLWVGVKARLGAAGAAGAYTDFLPTPDTVLDNARYYLGDGADVLLLSLVALGLVVAVLMLAPARTDRAEAWRDHLPFVGGFLAAGAAYAAVLALWRWGMSYYLLPVALCGSLALGVASADLAAVASAWGRGPRRAAAFAALAVAAVVLAGAKLYALPFLYDVTRLQRRFDRLESRVQELVLERMGGGGRVVDVDRPWFSEPPMQRTLLFARLGRPDLEWVGAGELFTPTDPAVLRLYGAVGREPPLASRPLEEGDLVLVHGVDDPIGLHVRGITPGAFVPRERVAERVAATEMRTGRRLIAVDRAVTTWTALEPWTLAPREVSLETRLFCAGNPLPVRVAWRGRWEDGWIGEAASVEIEAAPGAGAGRLHLRALPLPEVLPQRVTVSSSAGVERRIELTLERPTADLPLADLLSGGQGRVELHVAPTWQPARLNSASDDERFLGVLARYEPGPAPPAAAAGVAPATCLPAAGRVSP